MTRSKAYAMAMGILLKEKYVVEEKDGRYVLTEIGREYAESGSRRLPGTKKVTQ